MLFVCLFKFPASETIFDENRVFYEIGQMSGEHLVEFLPNSSITTFNNSKYRINKVEVCIWRGGGDQVSSRTRDIYKNSKNASNLAARLIPLMLCLLQECIAN